jgi:outer membrane protein
MKLQKTPFVLALLSFSSGIWAAAPSTWTLADCLVRAQERSLLIQGARLNEKSASSNLDQARKSRLPDLSASISQSLYDSPFAADPQDHYSLSLGLNSSVELWNGGRQSYNIAQKQYLAQSAQLSSAQTTQDLSESVITAYLQVWSLTESEKSAQEALLLARANLQKDSVLYNNGSLVASELSLSAATVASDSLSVLQAAHSRALAQTSLRQLLEIPAGESWSLAPPDSVLPKEPVALAVQQSNALARSATRQSDSLQILAAEAGVQVASAEQYPTISLGASAGTSLRAWESDEYGEQLKTGYNHKLTLGINIPIIDWGAAEAGVLQAQVSKERAELNAKTNSKQLENTIEKIAQQTEAARLQWQAAQLQLSAQEAALKVVNEKRTLGAVDNVTFMSQKAQYQNAQAKLNQAKYSYLLGHALLALYTGETP